MFKYATLLAGLLLAAPAFGEDGAAGYPDRPIKIVVCVPAGGGVDTVTRIVADKLRERLGQPVVVENRTGLSGSIGAEAVVGAEPDGYTLLASQPAPLTVNVLLYKKLNYDPSALVPVAVMTSIPNTLTVRPDFPATTIRDFIAYARAHPGTLNYASQGTGTTSHLTAALFDSKTGIRMQHVPYRGTAPAITDLIAGHVDLMFAELASAIHLHEAGKARILAVATKERVPALPDIPTFIEAGVPDFISDTWNAISAPPKTPPAIVAKLNAAIVDILKMPDVQERLKKLNTTPEAMTPAEAADFVKADMARWSGVIKAANIPPLE
ncbi:MAG TPA: tripartite tricarboxylate transporter substrate binding protein [Xanthobacteraceae bacterium]|nr:tripartite tricarboxylate transporter substrate binding protein [Xanthobacteraceae bacterium]